jgi:hypothetical protein
MDFKKNDLSLNYRNKKKIKIIYQYNLLINYFNNKNIYIFFYDFISKKNENKFKMFLNENNLKTIKLKKKIILNLNWNLQNSNLKNILNNNIFIIFTKEKIQKLNKNTLNNILHFKNIYFLGAWEDLKFYRPSEYKNLIYLQKDIKKNPILLLKNHLHILQKILSFKLI